MQGEDDAMFLFGGYREGILWMGWDTIKMFSYWNDILVTFLGKVDTSGARFRMPNFVKVLVTFNEGVEVFIDKAVL